MQRTLVRYFTGRSSPRHRVIRFSKVEMKEKNVMAAREKRQITYKEGPIRLTVDHSSETLKTGKIGGPIFSILKEKKLQPGIPCSAMVSFISREEIKLFSDKQVLREFATNRPVL